MTAEIVDTIPDRLIATLWAWFSAMPAYVRRSSGFDSSEDDFAVFFADDLKVLVYDGDDLLGFVSCQPVGSKGIFDVHLFCPRRVPTVKLTQAIDEFFRLVSLDPRIEKLLFSVRALQSRLGQIVIANGCVFTGWSYYEKGETFRCLVWEK